MPPTLCPAAETTPPTGAGRALATVSAVPVPTCPAVWPISVTVPPTAPVTWSAAAEVPDEPEDFEVELAGG
jgi:hypothetical protein